MGSANPFKQSGGWNLVNDQIFRANGIGFTTREKVTYCLSSMSSKRNSETLRVTRC